MKRQIFALGGGGFSADAPVPAIDQYFLNLTGKPEPRVCFIPTACGDSQIRIGGFFRACAQYSCRPSVLELFRIYPQDLIGFLGDQDAIFVGGGNTHNMMLLWRDRGVDVALRAAYESGVVMGGVSAGANCWFEQCSTDSWPGELRVMPGLGWLGGSFCPHYDEESNRRPTLERFLAQSEIGAGYAADGQVGLLFHDEVFAEAAANTKRGRAFEISYSDGLVETALPVRHLTEDPNREAFDTL